MLDASWRARRGRLRRAADAGAAARRSPQLRGEARRHLAAFESALAHLPAASMPAFLPVALVPGYLVGDGEARLRPVQDRRGGAAMAPPMGAVARGAALFAAHARLSRDVGEHRLADLLLAHDDQGRAVAHAGAAFPPRSASGRGCAGCGLMRRACSTICPPSNASGTDTSRQRAPREIGGRDHLRIAGVAADRLDALRLQLRRSASESFSITSSGVFASVSAGEITLPTRPWPTSTM